MFNNNFKQLRVKLCIINCNLIEYNTELNPGRYGSHKLDGPAVIWHDGSKYWWMNDNHHRADGPSIIWHNGNKIWYSDGKSIKLFKFI